MARIFLDGFEGGDLSQFGANSGAAIVSTSGLNMDGNYCLDLVTEAYAYLLLPTPEDDEIYMSFLYRPLSAKGSTWGSAIMSLYSGATLVARILKPAGFGNISAYAGETLLSTTARAFTGGTTFLVEWYYKIADSGGRCVVKVDGIIWMDFTGDTNVAAPTTFNSLQVGTDSLSDADAHYDNIILDDANWIGKRNIASNIANGAGATTQLTPSTGANYSCVDEVPPSATDYVSGNTNDLVDTYSVAAIPGTVAYITAFQVQANVVKTGTPTPQNVQLALRSGGTNYFSTSKAVPTTAAIVAGIWELDPATSAAFVVGATREIGVKLVA